MKFYPMKLFPIAPARTSRYAANLIPRHGMELKCSIQCSIISRSCSKLHHGTKLKHIKQIYVHINMYAPLLRVRGRVGFEWGLESN